MEISRSTIRSIAPLTAWAESRHVEMFVVGGTIRDILLERPIRDFDIVVPSGARQTAAAFSRHGHFPFIPLHEDPGYYRVVLSPAVTIDFVECQGGSLDEDLTRRDFTMNALAVPLTCFREPGSIASDIIDPTGGIEDIRHRFIRAISPSLFEQDPLRMLRVYRFQSELAFSIDDKLDRLVRSHVHTIERTANERIYHELMILSEGVESAMALTAMESSGLLTSILVKLGISRELLLDKTRLSAQTTLSRLEKLLVNLHRESPSGHEWFNRTANSPLTGGITVRALFTIATILPRELLPKQVEQFARNLTLSRMACKLLASWWRARNAIPRLLTQREPADETLQSLLFEFQDRAIRGSLLAALGDSPESPALTPEAAHRTLSRMIEIADNPDQEREKLLQIVTGHFLKELAPQISGRDFGQLLKRLHHGIRIGQLRSETEIRREVRNILGESAQEAIKPQLHDGA